MASDSSPPGVKPTVKRDREDDKYKCIKIPLKSIVKNTEHLRIINEVITRVNVLTANMYMLLSLWMFKKFDENQELPEIDSDQVLSNCFTNAFFQTMGRV